MNRFFDFNATELMEMGPITIFTRHKATELFLDEQLIAQERSNCLSVQMFCCKLERFEEEFNSNKKTRNRLLHFLESKENAFIYDITEAWSSYNFNKFPHSSTYEYLKALTTHLNELKVLFGIEEVLIYQNVRTHKLITTIHERLVEIDYDLSRFNLTLPHWNLNKTDYFLVLANGVRKVLLIDNIKSLKNITLTPGLFLFITTPLSNDDLQDLFSRHHPYIIVYRDEKGIIKTAEPFNTLVDKLNEIMTLASKIRNDNPMPNESKIRLTAIIDGLFEIEEHFTEYMRQTLKQVERNERNTQYIYNKIKSLKQLTTHIVFCDTVNVNNLFSRLGDLADSFNNFDVKSKTIGLLPSTIFSGIRNITTNSNLYRVKNDVLFHENNLTASLITWLKASLEPKGFFIIQEDQIANGRSDISIFSAGARVSIIESKLLQEHANEGSIKAVIAKGIFQLFSKYSDAVFQSFLLPPDLYLVLFCFDQNLRNLRKHTESALDEYQKEHHNITFTMMNSEHHQTIRFSLREPGGIFPDKVVYINLIIANLRTKDKN